MVIQQHKQCVSAAQTIPFSLAKSLDKLMYGHYHNTKHKGLHIIKTNYFCDQFILANSKSRKIMQMKNILCQTCFFLIYINL